MKGICFFNTAKAWGGGEKWHYEVSHYLHKKGYAVLVIAHNNGALIKKLRASGIPNEGIELGNLSFLNPFKYLALLKLIRGYNLDTIILNLSSDVKIAGLCAKKLGYKRIIYRRGSAIPIRNTVLNRFYFKKVLTEVLANSNATKKTILEHNDTLIAKEKIFVIHNGITISKEAEVVEEKNHSELVLLNLGRLEFQKNQKFLIELAQELKDRKLHYKMLIGGEGRLRPELTKMITDYKLANDVELNGFIEDPISFINKADIFLLPSFWEGFGYVLAEAALCKKPIVAFNTSSNPELVIDGKTGYLTPKSELNLFADKIVELATDKEKRIQFGLNGRKHIIENFDKTKQLQKVERYLLDEE